MDVQIITIERVPITSSAAISVGYDESRLLDIEFMPRKDGSQAIFRYENLDGRSEPINRAFYDRLTSGEESAGKLIHAMIRSRETLVTKIS